MRPQEIPVDPHERPAQQTESNNPDGTAPSGLRGARVLVVDDEAFMREMIAQMLVADGADAVSVDSGEAALGHLRVSKFDLVILDVGLPGISGLETLRSIREDSDIPVMIVSAASALDERVTGFDLGADDYVVKPVEIPELSRRARAILRRARGGSERLAEVLEGPGGLVIRLRSHEALIGDTPINLTPKEFELLCLLLNSRGKIVRLDELSLSIWGYEEFGSRNFVEAHVSRLRAKLAKSGMARIVETVRGQGYMIR